jgi:hypothetical protein
MTPWACKLILRENFDLSGRVKVVKEERKARGFGRDGGGRATTLPSALPHMVGPAWLGFAPT